MMDISNIISDVRQRILGANDRIPLYLSAASVISGALSLLMYLLAVVFGAAGPFRLIYSIARIFSTLGNICGLLLGIYLLILFKKSFIIWMAAAGAAGILNAFLALFGTRIFAYSKLNTLQWILTVIYCVSLAMYDYTRGDKNSKDLGIVGFALLGAQILLNLLVSATVAKLYYVAGGRIYYLLEAIVMAVSLVSSLVHLATICTASDYIGGAQDVIAPIVSRIAEKLPASLPGKSSGTAAGSPVTGAVSTPSVTDVPPVTAAAAADTVNVIRSVPASGKVDVDTDALTAASKGAAAGVPAEALAQIAEATTTPGPGKVQYKTVAGPVELTVGKNDSFETGVRSYAAIIDREAVGGWKLDSIYEIPVTRKVGCIDSLMGRPDVTVFFNMLIFYKED